MPCNHNDLEKGQPKVDYHQHCSPAPDGGCEFYFTGGVPIPPLSARPWRKAYIADSPCDRDTCLDFMTPSFTAALEAGELDQFYPVVTLWWMVIFPSDVLKGTPRQIYTRFNGDVEAVELAVQMARLAPEDLEEHLRYLLLWNARRGVVVRVERPWLAELEYAMGVYHRLHPYHLRSTCRAAPTSQQLQQEFAADILLITSEIYNPLPSPSPTPPPEVPSYTVFESMSKRRLPHRAGWHWMPN
ncbi:hypothetical protein VKT23_017480 [Stygiomarasmius scandens]|uniref:Uncharacterized protein n=1 Tax=Marasmiellus scandens TaxID=2682957 RepID=A0ABR1IRV1_9AGAR